MPNAHPTHLTIEGRTLTVEEWAEEYGIPASLIRARLRKAWFPDRAVTTPMQPSVADQLTLPDATTPAAQRVVVPSAHAPLIRPILSSRPRRPIVKRRRGRGAVARLIEFEGQALTVREWATHLQVQPQLIHYRLRMNWPLERVLDGKVGPTAQRNRQ